MNHNFIDKLYSDLENDVYSKYNLVNVKEVEKNKEKLLYDIQYLPYFIRIYLRDEYNNIILQNNEIYKKVKEDAEKDIKDKTQYFINWIHNHKEYSKILNEKQLQQLNIELKEIKMEIDYIKKVMK